MLYGTTTSLFYSTAPGLFCNKIKMRTVRLRLSMHVQRARFRIVFFSSRVAAETERINRQKIETNRHSPWRYNSSNCICARHSAIDIPYIHILTQWAHTKANCRCMGGRGGGGEAMRSNVNFERIDACQMPIFYK